MSYPPPPRTEAAETAPSEARVRDFLLDVAARKEFRALAPGRGPPPSSDAARPHPYGYGLGPGASSAAPAIGGLRLHGAQLFVQNFSNPDTPYTRLLLNWQTGTGKTIGAIAIAQEYIRQYRARVTVRPADRPTVFVVGFTKTIIQAEMLRHPEFGFVSPEEVVELRRLRVLAETRHAAPATPESRHYGGYVGVLKRRITDRTRGGYYQFYGYKEFANRLFTVTRRGAARGFTVAGLYARERKPPAKGSGGAEAGVDADADGDQDPAAEPTFLDRIDAAVAAGDVEVNQALLDSLRGGLVVCDEIHNTYNIQTKNNYGVAIQYVLDKLAAVDGAEPPRAVFMSATVTGGVATEIVDLLNFLVPVADLPGGRRLRRAEFFRAAEGAASGKPGGRRKLALLPGALARIGRLSAGRVSFLLDTDEASYPRRIFEGEPLPNPLRPGARISYLRFTPCPMAPFHEKTLARMLAARGAPPGARIAVPANAYTLYDMAYPNPGFGPRAAASPRTRSGGPSEAYGLYLSAETPTKLAGAPSAWRAAAGVTVESLKGDPGVRAGVPSLISGPFLALAPARAGAPPGVAAYSAKYHRLGSDLLEIVGAGPGKVMVYHHRVRMSGVLQIQELLETNGFLDETSAPSPATICAVCGVARRSHTAAAAERSWAGVHSFTPARYVMANSEIDRGLLDRSIARYNAPSNASGFEFRVLVGSKIIREGFDLKAVRFQLIASLPTDIPTLIQVFGRVVRKNSHLGLPEGQRDVRIRIYVSTAGEFTRGGGPAPEVVRYAEKMESYFLTQEVEKALRRYAVDAFINHARLVASDPALLETPNIDAVPYRPAITLEEARGRPETTATFEAYGHGDREVETVKAAAAALFEVQPVWTYDDLWSAVRSGRVEGVGQDPASFAEASFALALDGLGLHSPFVTRGAELASQGLELAGGALISRVGDFYVRSPAGPGGQPVLDIESYVRDNAALAPLRVKVLDYVRAARTSLNFAVRLREFEAEFADAETPIEEAFVRYDADFHNALLVAVVEGHAGGGGLAAEVHRKAGAAGSPLARIVDLYVRFRVLVTGGDVAEAPDAKRLVRAARPPRAGSRTPVGYVTDTAVRLYARSGAAKGWYDIPRKALGIGTRYAENDIVVGYVERRGANLRFKIRPPIHQLSAAAVRDVRSLARGAVCGTRPRAEQETLVRRLKAVPARELASFSSAELCREMRRKLLALEEAARNRKTGMLDGPRYFYLFNDQRPTVTLRR
jgi:hypothetical protein